MISTHTVSWFLRIVAAIIMLQTLYFKFSAAPESVYIFSTLGMEPWGRIATGIAELVASALILFPKTVTLGAAMGVGIMAGALIAHLTKLGIAVQADGGYLFFLCMVVLICCLLLLWLHRMQISALLKQFGILHNKQRI